MDHPSLGPSDLRRPIDPASLGFATTADLDDLDEVVGQDRAVEAVEFAVGMRSEGYNLYALGPEGIGKQHVIRGFLERAATHEPRPDDWGKNPDGSVIDFLSFARTEGRFAQHFGADGTPTTEILGTQEDRLANWHELQELAGIR